jgi:drug/metabolite transporter (DMT)-like permease
VKTGFLSVALFASLLGVATIIHWGKFNHGHVAFWLWAGLCFTAPFLVFGAWLANRRFAAPAGVDEPRLSSVARWIVGLIGLLALVQGRPKHRVRHPRQGQERQ